MEQEGCWTKEMMSKVLSQPPVKFKYIVTNDKAEFIERMDRIIKARQDRGEGNNLSYLEDLTKMKQIEAVMAGK